eukprot:Phypoly_transcript_05565.p1 GENE.Phypoly_transcript_05565~~Phypoly_transcript_05565.p1  ORF type:complete len:123 (-),score=16.22 Phypoly_transcript_05565:320-688(-)
MQHQPIQHPQPQFRQLYTLSTSSSEVSTFPLISEEPKRLQHQPVQPQHASSIQSQQVPYNNQLLTPHSLFQVWCTSSYKPEESTGSQPTPLKITKDLNSLKSKGHNFLLTLISNQILLHHMY